MAKKKIEIDEVKRETSYLEGIEGNILASIRLAKAEYERKPSNPMYSIITDLELTLSEIKKLS
jgi:hypothetical protein